MAVFLVNQCTFSKQLDGSGDDINKNGIGNVQCGLTFGSLFELIHHIEDKHINDVESSWNLQQTPGFSNGTTTGNSAVNQKNTVDNNSGNSVQASQIPTPTPSCLPISCVLRLFAPQPQSGGQSTVPIPQPIPLSHISHTQSHGMLGGLHGPHGHHHGHGHQPHGHALHHHHHHPGHHQVHPTHVHGGHSPHIHAHPHGLSHPHQHPHHQHHAHPHQHPHHHPAHPHQINSGQNHALTQHPHHHHPNQSPLVVTSTPQQQHLLGMQPQQHMNNNLVVGAQIDTTLNASGTTSAPQTPSSQAPTQLQQQLQMPTNVPSGQHYAQQQPPDGLQHGVTHLHGHVHPQIHMQQQQHVHIQGQPQLMDQQQQQLPAQIQTSQIISGQPANPQSQVNSQGQTTTPQPQQQQRQYTCETCGRAYKTPHGLRTHMNNNHGMKPAAGGNAVKMSPSSNSGSITPAPVQSQGQTIPRSPVSQQSNCTTPTPTLSATPTPGGVQGHLSQPGTPAPQANTHIEYDKLQPVVLSSQNQNQNNRQQQQVHNVSQQSLSGKQLQLPTQIANSPITSTPGGGNGNLISTNGPTATQGQQDGSAARPPERAPQTPRQYTCDQCSRSYKTPHGLRSHMNNNHGMKSASATKTPNIQHNASATIAQGQNGQQQNTTATPSQQQIQPIQSGQTVQVGQAGQIQTGNVTQVVQVQAGPQQQSTANHSNNNNQNFVASNNNSSNNRQQQVLVQMPPVPVHVQSQQQQHVNTTVKAQK